MTNITKNLIVTACLQKQTKQVETLDNKVQRMQADTFGQRASASQCENRSTEKVDMLHAFTNKLRLAKAKLTQLEALDANQASLMVEQGAVVVTNHLSFFIGFASGKIKVEGQDIYVLSTKAPIYAPMRGLKTGDTFTFNGKEFDIKNVY